MGSSKSKPKPKFKLLLALLALFWIGLPAYAASDKVSINMKDVPLKNVLKSIERQTDYRFFYSKESINVNEKVSVKVAGQTVAAVLDNLLPSYGIGYTIDKKRIILNKVQSKASNATQANKTGKGEKVKVLGKVSDAKGEPLIGVSVRCDKTGAGAVSDIEGNYAIEVPLGSNLSFTYVGYTPAKKKVEKAGQLDVVLSEDSKVLSEVVVIGYGTMDKKELTSAISHVGEKDFLTISSSDPAMLIQGKVPGVSITNTGAGDPNNQASIQIRGVSSRSAGLGPLIVIDGVPGGDLTNVNPNDIASFDILKDGAASAIYGTRGSNGVIVVTTKKGAKDGSYKVTYSGSVAWDKIIDELDFMDADDYRNIRLGWSDSGTDLGGNYDWFKGVSRTGFAQKHTLSISGGTQRANFRVSADYRNSNGVDLRSNREEYGARASMELKSKGDLFDFNINVAPRIIYKDYADWNVFGYAKQANPTTPLMDVNSPQLYYNFQGQVCPYNPVEVQDLEKNHGETKLLDWDATAKINLLPLLWNSQKECPFKIGRAHV